MIKNSFLSFEAALEKAADKLKIIKKEETVKIISNLDADGITSASIIIKMLERAGLAYNLCILHQLKEEDGKELSEAGFNYYIFCDLGSGQLNILNKYFKDKQVFIFDHHDVQGKPEKNITHINPHLFGIDGSSEISAAGVCFLFAKTVNKKNNDLAHLAIIGALGDVQEYKGFKNINNNILKTAVNKRKIKVEKGPRLFGLQTRPLHKLLEYSSNLMIPGVSNNSKGVALFLKSINFSRKIPKGTTYNELIKRDQQALVKAIIKRRKEEGIKDAEDVFTKVYILEGEEGIFKDAREFSTLLNSCGRLDQAEIGIGVCLGDKEDREKVHEILRSYRRSLMIFITWFKREFANPFSKSILKGDNYIIVNAQDKVYATMIGTLASIVSKGNDLDDNLFVLSMARNSNNTTKISLRYSCKSDEIDLKSIVLELMNKVGGEAGGHQQAAGALIDTDKEEVFIEEAKKLFDSYPDYLNSK